MIKHFRFNLRLSGQGDVLDIMRGFSGAPQCAVWRKCKRAAHTCRHPCCPPQHVLVFVAPSFVKG